MSIYINFQVVNRQKPYKEINFIVINMALDDKFNSGNESTIDRLDTILYDFYKEIGIGWQNTTHRGKEDLERGLYFASAIAFGGHTAYTKHLLAAIPAVIAAIKGSTEAIKPGNAKREEAQCEAMGLPSKTMKYIDVGLYGLGVVETLIGTGYLIAGTVFGNNELLPDSIKHLSIGLGGLGFMSAEYMAKSNIGTPPPKRKKQSKLKTIAKTLKNPLPQQAPTLVPVPIYSEANTHSSTQPSL
jgi:hypothetical protein